MLLTPELPFGWFLVQPLTRRRSQTQRKLKGESVLRMSNWIEPSAPIETRLIRDPAGKTTVIRNVVT